MAYNLESLIKIIEQIMQPHPWTLATANGRPETESLFRKAIVKIKEKIMHPHHLDRCRWTLDPKKRPQIESLLIKARALKRLFVNSSPLTAYKRESLESRIRDAAYEAEDILESYLVDRIRSVGGGVSFTFSPPSLKKVIKDLDSVEEEITKMMDIGSHIPDSSSPAAALSRTDPNPKKIFVGLSQDSIRLKDRLTGQESKLMIIPIVGMGGIGKTTLARYVYDDPLIVSHFDTRAWVTISQEYNVRVILLGLLECVIGKLPYKMSQKQNDQLAVHLHQSLCGRRYLTVLDDMWDTKAWDDIQRFFPDDKNGSSVVVTTREMSVANYAASDSLHHQMHLLNQDDSWSLLHEKVFAEESCPPELEKIGKRIAHNCGGLPLAIQVIGGVLSEATRTEEYWLQVGKDVTSVIANNDEQFSKILSLSYNHLPNHLKPCFLYMSAFPEDYEIRSSRLIRLWVAEGFLETVSNKSLEEAAEMYLKALVDRNLIFIRRQETNGIAKNYGMHDLLRDLCVRKASEEKFLYIENRLVRRFPEDTRCVRRVSAHNSNFASMELISLARSFVWAGARAHRDKIPTPAFFALRLLRVLDLLGMWLDKFPWEILQLINLRYLALECSSYFPSSISALWNLQTLILKDFIMIWSIEDIHGVFGISQLRHLKFKETYPLYKLQDGKSFALHENLQTLSGMTVDLGFDRIIESVPNLKKLGIVCFPNYSLNIDLRCLGKLETLKCASDFLREGQCVLPSIIFPSSLKKLTLSNYEIPIGCMNEIGRLPNLEVLKLRDSILESSTWEPAEGEFSRLQYLLLENLNLEKWEADESHFPRLERLIVRKCTKLEEIPLSIGEIPTLEIIEVQRSSPYAMDSARRILEEQLELGNDGLQVLISGSIKRTTSVVRD